MSGRSTTWTTFTERSELSRRFGKLAGSFEGIPGKKTVIWLTGDASPLNPTLLYRIIGPDKSAPTQATPWWEMAKTCDLLNASGISVFPLDIRGVANPGLLSAAGKMSRDDFNQTVRGAAFRCAAVRFPPQGLIVHGE